MIECIRHAPAHLTLAKASRPGEMRVADAIDHLRKEYLLRRSWKHPQSAFQPHQSGGISGFVIAAGNTGRHPFEDALRARLQLFGMLGHAAISCPASSVAAVRYASR